MTKSVFTIALVGLLATTAAASAQQVRLLDESRAWSSYGATDASGQVCFAMTKPESVTPTPDGYSQAYISTSPTAPARALPASSISSPVSPSSPIAWRR